MSLSKEQQLWGAATKGDLQMVVALAGDPRVDVNWKDPEDGRTTFYRACGYGQSEVVKYLLALPKVDPNSATKEVATPFYIACATGSSSVVPLLLADQRIDVNKAYKDGATPFFIACEQGHSSVVSMLLADQRIDVNKPMNDNSTPLWFASQQGRLTVVQLMLASGRNIDTQTRSKFDNTTAAEVGRAIGNRAKGANDTDELVQRKTNGPVIADLIDAYEKDSAGVRSKLRKELGLKEPTTFLKELETRTSDSAKIALSRDLETRASNYTVDSVLKCRLCSQHDDHKTVRNPKTLPCLHSFCQICLEQQDRQVNQLNGDTIKCQQCSAPFKIPTGGIKSLECCAFVNSLSKSAQGPPVDPNRAKCDTCDAEEATLHCVECSEILGPSCSAVHKKMKMSASHKLVPIDDVLEGKIEFKRVPRCQKHPAQEINVYCKTCKEATCSKCGIEMHSGHQLCPLSEIATQSKDDIVTYTVTMAAKEKEAEKWLPTFNTAVNKLEDQCTAAEKEIAATCAVLRAAVDDREKQLKTDVNEARNKTVKEKNQVETVVVQLREFRVFTEGLLVQGTPLEIAGTHEDVKARNEVLENLEFPAKPSREPVIKFQPGNVDQLKQAIAAIGAISSSN